MRKGPGSVYDKWNISMTQIFHNGQPSHGCDRKTSEVMTSTYPRGTIVSVASLLAAILYQGNPDRNHKLWNIVSTERCILHIFFYASTAAMLLHINGTFTMGQFKSFLLS
jgi:hypothetical protein